MSLRSLSLLASLALWSFQCSARPPERDGIALELRKDSVVADTRIVLSDVVIIDGSNYTAEVWADIPLGRAPRIGQVARFNRMQIEHAIQRHSPDATAIIWSGAAAVGVHRRARLLPSQLISDAAIAGIKTQFADAPGSTTVELAEPVGDTEVPLGSVDLRLRTAPAMLKAGRASVWIDIFINNEIYRSVVVRLKVAVRRQAWVALHAAPQGTLLNARDFVLADTEEGSTAMVPTASKVQPFRSARAIRAGQPLSYADILLDGTVIRGDRVRVLINAGQIGIETGAIAMANGGPGESLSVRPFGARDIITGRVSNAGTVVIE